MLNSDQENIWRVFWYESISISIMFSPDNVAPKQGILAFELLHSHQMAPRLHQEETTLIFSFGSTTPASLARRCYDVNGNGNTSLTTINTRGAFALLHFHRMAPRLLQEDLTVFLCSGTASLAGCCFGWVQGEIPRQIICYVMCYSSVFDIIVNYFYVFPSKRYTPRKCVMFRGCSPACWDILFILCRREDKQCTLAFSPDGTKIVSGGHEDGYIRLWDSQSGKMLLRFGFAENYRYKLKPQKNISSFSTSNADQENLL